MKRKNGNGNMRISLIKKNGNMRMSLAHWHGEISVMVISYVNHLSKKKIICEPPLFDGSEIFDCCTSVTLNLSYVTQE
jgi:hypothetical protein